MSLIKLKATGVSLLIVIVVSGMAFAAPLSGIYTIGGSAPNYATFNDAVSDLVTNGVSGSVTFNVRPGTYNEQIKVTAVAGSSAFNTVTFQAETSNATDVVLTYSGSSPANYVVDLNGTSYINFNEMTIQATGSTYSTAINLENSSTYNTFTYLVVTSPVVTNSSANNILMNMMGDGSNCSYNSIYHSTLTGGSYGMYAIYGGSYASGIAAEYNSFVNQYAGAIDEQRCLQGATIKYNIITTNATDTSYNAIKISIEEDTISDNQIYHCPGNGINHDNCSPYIFNNFVEIEGNGINYGILHKMDNYCADKVFVSGNTVLVKNTNSQSAAFSLPFPGYTWNFPFNFLRDNLFINRGGGYAISIVNTGSVSTGSGYGVTPFMDYNDYYTTGSNIGVWGTTTCTTLTNWQSTTSPCGCGADAHSININPSFVSDYNLHITVDNVRAGINAPEEGSVDIDGDTRNPTTPDIGADELTGPVQLHASFSASPGTTICDSSSVNFTDNSSGFPTGWKWTFTGGTPSASISQNPTVAYNTTGTFSVKLVVTNSSGSDSITQSGYITVNALAAGGTVSAGQAAVCSGNLSQLSVTGAMGSIQWQSSTDGITFSDIPGATTSSYTAGPLAETTYYMVKATNSCGSKFSASQKITVTPQPVAGTLLATHDTICAGSSGNLSLSGNSGGLIQWQSSSTNSNFANIQNAPDSSKYKTQALQSSAWFRAIIDTANCISVTDSIELMVPPPLTASFTEVMNGKTITFNSSGSLGHIIGYYWDFGDGTDTTEANPVHTFAKDTIYHTCLTIYDGSNCSYTTCNDVSIPLAVATIGAEGTWLVYPDPFGNELYADGKSLNSEVKSIVMRDVLGRTVINKTVSVSGNSAFYLDVSSLAKGMYYLTITTANAQYVQKVVKQ